MWSLHSSRQTNSQPLSTQLFNSVMEKLRVLGEHTAGRPDLVWSIRRGSSEEANLSWALKKEEELTGWGQEGEKLTKEMLTERG